MFSFRAKFWHRIKNNCIKISFLFDEDTKLLFFFFNSHICSKIFGFATLFEGIANDALLLFYARSVVFAGKEIDHRLKIYFEVNSSVDRIVYRLLLGMTFVILVYNLLDIFSYKWSINFFLVFLDFVWTFYSWPTKR